VKDLFGWQANVAPDRLTAPLIRNDDRLVETDWDTAMGLVVQRRKELLEEQGPSALGFYTTGQLFLEEYYTLGVIAHGAIGTNHVDGNTRLCTATAAEALKESFACDGQPGSYSDVDHADVIALYGHNVAETQTVLWMRMLDRLAGGDLRGSAGDAGGAGSDGAPGTAARHQRGPDERAATRDHPQRLGGLRLRRRACQFWAAPEYCESYGRHLVTGAPLEPTEYRAMNPGGKAVIKATEYLPAHEVPSDEFPLYLITGRTAYHFHTRTKTGGRRRYRPLHRGCGWRCRSRTPTPTASARVTWWRSAPRAARSMLRSGSAASARACCSCRSTTATGTRPTLISTAPRTIGPPTS
jgi:anaerobic selenocysteine-containing dehydrogenase